MGTVLKRTLVAAMPLLALGALLPHALSGQAPVPDPQPIAACLEEFSRYVHPDRYYRLQLARTDAGAMVTLSDAEFGRGSAKYTLAGTCVWREGDGGTAQITMTDAAVDATDADPHLGGVLKAAFGVEYVWWFSHDAWTFRYYPSKYWPARERGARSWPDVYKVSINGLGGHMGVYVGENGEVLWGIELGL